MVDADGRGCRGMVKEEDEGCGRVIKEESEGGKKGWKRKVEFMGVISDGKPGWRKWGVV